MMNKFRTWITQNEIQAIILGLMFAILMLVNILVHNLSRYENLQLNKQVLKDCIIEISELEQEYWYEYSRDTRYMFNGFRTI